MYFKVKKSSKFLQNIVVDRPSVEQWEWLYTRVKWYLMHVVWESESVTDYSKNCHSHVNLQISANELDLWSLIFCMSKRRLQNCWQQIIALTKLDCWKLSTFTVWRGSIFMMISYWWVLKKTIYVILYPTSKAELLQLPLKTADRDAIQHKCEYGSWSYSHS